MARTVLVQTGTLLGLFSCGRTAGSRCCVCFRWTGGQNIIGSVREGKKRQQGGVPWALSLSLSDKERETAERAGQFKTYQWGREGNKSAEKGETNNGDG